MSVSIYLFIYFIIFFPSPELAPYEAVTQCRFPNCIGNNPVTDMTRRDRHRHDEECRFPSLKGNNFFFL